MLAPGRQSPATETEKEGNNITMIRLKSTECGQSPLAPKVTLKKTDDRDKVPRR